MFEKQEFEENMKKVIDSIDMKTLLTEFIQLRKDEEKYGGCFDNPQPHPDK